MTWSALTMFEPTADPAWRLDAGDVNLVFAGLPMPPTVGAATSSFAGGLHA